ncbi:MAG: LptF/LptG family permease [Verrucomicrobiota bacterium]
MLKLLHRHILKEIFVASSLAIGLFVFVLLIGNAMKDIVALVAAGKLELAVFAKLLGLLLPYVAVWALPLGVLTGTLLALGRLSSQREITAMKSAGLSIYHIAAPVFFIAFTGMILGIVVNLQYGPQSRKAYKQLLIDAVRQNPISFIEEKRFIHEFPGYVIYMGAQDGRRMEDFWIWELDAQQRVQLFLRAAEGVIDFRDAENSLVLTLKNGTAERRDPDDPEAFSREPPQSLFFDELPISLPLDDVFGEKNKRRVKTKELSFAELMSVREKALEAEEGGGMSPERLDVQMHLQKNFAMAFSVFSLAVFGVPLAIQVGRKETSANLGIALVIVMTYYFLMIVVSWLEDSIALRPDLLIWLPNLLFQGLGFYLLRRANRH